MLVVHLTAFNQLMWNNGRSPTCVIEHGVLPPQGIAYSGELERGIAVINNLRLRGRRLGADVFGEARARVPLDLVGMDAVAAGGLGEVPHAELAAFMARCRFFFNPIRHTTMGLAVIEAMLTGLPIVALDVHDELGGIGGAVARLVVADNRHHLGGRERFGIERFVADWQHALCAIAMT